MSAGATAEQQVSNGRDTGRPNIVLIFMDDLVHWAIDHSSEIATPNIDRISSAGTRLTHAFNQGSWSPAVCVPARAMLITGRSLFHAEDCFGPDAAPVENSLGQVLGKAGYSTYFTGKWHQPEAALTSAYVEVGAYNGGMLLPLPASDGSQDVGRPAPGNTWSPTDVSLGGHWLDVDGRIIHSSVRWADEAVGFLERQAGTDRPFFLHLAFHAPHDPRQAPADWLARYPAGNVRVPPNALPEHPFDQGHHRVRDELLAPFPRTDEAIRLHRSEYFAIVAHVDAQIGRVLDALERSHGDDTIVVFSGDHGLALGEHGLMGKQSCYDHSVRVPLVFAGPGIAAGAKVDELVYQGSIFATLCALAGVPAPPDLEFPSLAPLLQSGSETTPRSSTVFGAYMGFQRLVRTPHHALIAYRDVRRVQLFDMDADPWQMNDLAGEPRYRTIVDGLLAELRRLQAELDDNSGEWTGAIDASWFGP